MVARISPMVWIRVERSEHIARPLGLSLVPAGFKCLGQQTPVGIKPGIGHLEKAAHIGWLASVEEQIRLGRIAVAPIMAIEQFERDKRVKEIARRAIVEPEPPRQGGKIGRPLGEFREDPKLDGA